MSIQIFGREKCFDTKKACRFFKERGIRFQFVDLSQKEMSRKELESVCRAVGGISVLLDEKAKDRDSLALVKYIAEEDRLEKLLSCQQVLKTPIVRNGQSATTGYHPEVWKNWS